MNFEVIQALQAVCGSCVDPAIERDYICTTEAWQSSDVLLKAIADLPQVDELRAGSECAHKEQSFVNSFRFGAMMAGDVTDNLARLLQRLKSPQGGNSDMGGANCYVG